MAMANTPSLNASTRAVVFVSQETGRPTPRLLHRCRPSADWSRKLVQTLSNNILKLLYDLGKLTLVFHVEHFSNLFAVLDG